MPCVASLKKNHRFEWIIGREKSIFTINWIFDYIPPMNKMQQHISRQKADFTIFFSPVCIRFIVAALHSFRLQQFAFNVGRWWNLYFKFATFFYSHHRTNCMRLRYYYSTDGKQNETKKPSEPIWSDVVLFRLDPHLKKKGNQNI